jgi:hypothetical protein
MDEPGIRVIIFECPSRIDQDQCRRLLLSDHELRAFIPSEVGLSVGHADQGNHAFVLQLVEVIFGVVEDLRSVLASMEYNKCIFSLWLFRRQVRAPTLLGLCGAYRHKSVRVTFHVKVVPHHCLSLSQGLHFVAQQILVWADVYS